MVCRQKQKKEKFDMPHAAAVRNDSSFSDHHDQEIGVGNEVRNQGGLE
jgi:hypothetical protein